MTLIDIREFYTKDGEELPSKKGILLKLGISLQLENWNRFKSYIPLIDAAI
jgi:hypothetical protein